MILSSLLYRQSLLVLVHSYASLIRVERNRTKETLIATTSGLIIITTDIHQLEFSAGVTRIVTAIPLSALPFAAVYS